MLQLIIAKVLETQFLSSTIETLINRTVWKQNFQDGDLEALDQLMDAIEAGKVMHQK